MRSESFLGGSHLCWSHEPTRRCDEAPSHHRDRFETRLCRAWACRTEWAIAHLVVVAPGEGMGRRGAEGMPHCTGSGCCDRLGGRVARRRPARSPPRRGPSRVAPRKSSQTGTEYAVGPDRAAMQGHTQRAPGTGTVHWRQPGLGWASSPWRKIKLPKPRQAMPAMSRNGARRAAAVGAALASGRRLCQPGKMINDAHFAARPPPRPCALFGVLRAAGPFIVAARPVSRVCHTFAHFCGVWRTTGWRCGLRCSRCRPPLWRG